MKKLVFVLILACILYLLFFKATFQKTREKTVDITRRPTSEITEKVKDSPHQKKSSIFVPYWALGQGEYEIASYDRYYYFAIAPTTNGINTQEPGYQGLESFICPKQRECFLVVRMLNSDINSEVLTNGKVQDEIVSQTLEIAKKGSFDGIALNLEMQSFFNDDLKGQINVFVQKYYTAAKKDYKMFSFIVYGDTFFRKRQFDISFIGSHSDEIMVMAYDFHKSYGEPGPNFPFNRRSLDKGGHNMDYNYDFKQMISDFVSHVPKEKLTVIFGMYGYDWTLNAQGTPLKRAKALTYNEIQNLKSQMSNIKSHSTNAREQMIEYHDKEGFTHVIWYEDKASVAVKEEYLMQQGIGSVSYWAYSYF